MDDLYDASLRLAIATVAGMAIGLNRDLKGKPTGMRTLGLVSLGAAIVSVAAVHVPGIAGHADALSRVVQGIIQGVLAGIGFIGAGVVIRRPDLLSVENLTTAATVWVSASLGIACGLAAWPIVGIGLAMTFAVLLLGGPIERLFHRLVGAPDDTE